MTASDSGDYRSLQIEAAILTADAMALRCPLCGASPGVPCTVYGRIVADKEKIDPTVKGEVDVYRWVLREAVMAGSCDTAKGVMYGWAPLDDLGTENDECIWCHLVWCFASDEENDRTGDEEAADA